MMATAQQTSSAASRSLFAAAQKDPPSHPETPPTSPDSPESGMLYVSAQDDAYSDITECRTDKFARRRDPPGESPVTEQPQALAASPSTSFLTRVLGAVDTACTPSAETPVRKNGSKPSYEWGVPPVLSQDDDDMHPEELSVLQSPYDATITMYTTRYTSTRISGQDTVDTRPTPERTLEHENFEMVLSEDEDDAAPPRRHWRNVFRNRETAPLGIAKRETETNTHNLLFPSHSAEGWTTTRSDPQQSSVKTSQGVEVTAETREEPPKKQRSFFRSRSAGRLGRGDETKSRIWSGRQKETEEETSREVTNKPVEQGTAARELYDPVLLSAVQEDFREKPKRSRSLLRLGRRKETAKEETPLEEHKEPVKQDTAGQVEELYDPDLLVAVQEDFREKPKRSRSLLKLRRRNDTETVDKNVEPEDEIQSLPVGEEGVECQAQSLEIVQPEDSAQEKSKNRGARLVKAVTSAKLLKKMRKKKARNTLDPIVENPVEYSKPSESTELKVRVPGTDDLLSSEDLIGEIVEEEDEEDEEEGGDVHLNDHDECTINTLHSNGIDSSAIRFRPEVETVTEEPSLIQKAFSWNKDDTVRSGGDTVTDIFSERSLTRVGSAPMAMQSKSFSYNPSNVNRQKPLWKTAVDPSTGRTYYYHRLTRESTWTKPPDEELVKRKIAEEDEIDMTDNQVDDEKLEEEKKEIDESSASVLRKKSPRDFDPEVWSKKEEVIKLLTQMSPPNGTSIERIVGQYEGREDELLNQLRDLAESQPFDEPLNRTSTPKRPGVDFARTRTNVSANTYRTGPSTKTATTGTTRASLQTERIRNTSDFKGPSVAAINEDEGSHATSISSQAGVNIPKPVVLPGETVNRPIPSRIPVPRMRDLKVEDLSNDRFSTDRYRVKPSSRAARLRHEMHRKKHGINAESHDANAYHGDDDDDTDVDTRDTSSVPTDSVSALSVGDDDFPKASLNLEHRRALDRAIANEDWDLAAKLSEQMRSRHPTRVVRSKRTTREWSQSELDRFISENDWDAVASYIAQVRSTEQPNKPTRVSSRHRRATPSDSSNSNPRKRFGARSQLQHEDLYASSSSSYSSYDSEYSSGSYSSEDQLRHAVRGRKKKEFVC